MVRVDSNLCVYKRCQTRNTDTEYHAEDGNEMAWEIFDRTTTSRTTEPTANITKGGLISLNSAAFEALGRPEAVELRYDPSAKLVGLKSEHRSARTYAVRKARRVNSYTVFAKAFLKHFGIEHGVARRRSARMDRAILVFEAN